MANKDAKVKENVAGKYYCDDSCSACAVCSDEAPNNFKMTDDESYAYVYKQPENDEEEAACRDAMESCPEEAIGDDG
ncbi:MAG: ferredoxin [bacterium]